jgi:AcrR family transcriptional regulator
LQALIAAVVEKGWDEVSVQEVCRRAGVGRSTFYTHFADKEELLLSGLDDLAAGLRAQRDRRQPLSFVRGIFAHVERHSRDELARILVLLRRRGGPAVRERLTVTVIELLADEVRGVQREARIRFLAGAFVELLGWWLDQRGRMPASEAAELYRRLALPLLTS